MESLTVIRLILEFARTMGIAAIVLLLLYSACVQTAQLPSASTQSRVGR